MKLKDIIFTDGKLRRAERQGDSFLLEFVDFNNSPVTINFSGVSESKVHSEALVLSIQDYVVSKIETGKKLSLLDDNNHELLTVIFSDSEVQK